MYFMGGILIRRAGSANNGAVVSHSAAVDRVIPNPVSNRKSARVSRVGSSLPARSEITPHILPRRRLDPTRNTCRTFAIRNWIRD